MRSASWPSQPCESRARRLHGWSPCPVPLTILQPFAAFHLIQWVCRGKASGPLSFTESLSPATGVGAATPPVGNRGASREETAGGLAGLPGSSRPPSVAQNTAPFPYVLFTEVALLLSLQAQSKVATFCGETAGSNPRPGPRLGGLASLSWVFRSTLEQPRCLLAFSKLQED